MVRSSDSVSKAMTDDDGVMRKAPTQKRSRERVEQILTCATQLIAARGSDTMRMSEVAAMAGISIGSLYQYFPDKAAIVRTLAERYHDASRACIAEALAEARSPDDLNIAFAGLIDEYYALFRAEPVMGDIWCAMQADQSLRSVELEQSRINASLVANAIARVFPNVDRAGIDTQALLIMSLGESTMRLAVSTTVTEGAELVAAYKRMALASLSSLRLPELR
jgi:AcrR family transcriptional regulator